MLLVCLDACPVCLHVCQIVRCLYVCELASVRVYVCVSGGWHPATSPAGAADVRIRAGPAIDVCRPPLTPGWPIQAHWARYWAEQRRDAGWKRDARRDTGQNGQETRRWAEYRQERNTWGENCADTRWIPGKRDAKRDSGQERDAR